MNLETIKKKLKLYYKQILSILFISIIFPTILADYNQRAEITKITYEVDYKSAKNKYLECNKYYDQYIISLQENASTASLLQRYYNVDRLRQDSYSEVYFISFKGLIDKYNKSLDGSQELSAKTSFCYRELDNLYGNLALSLNITKKYEKTIKKSDTHILEVKNKRNQFMKNFDEKYKEDFLYDMFEAMITENDEKIFQILEELNFGDLAELQNNRIILEIELFNVKQKQISELNQLFSKQINRRFNHGIYNYIISFIPFI